MAARLALLCALVFALLSALACQAAAASMLRGPAIDSEEPIDITADSAEFDDPAGTIIYRGNVEMRQGPVEVTADLVTILLEEEEVVRITAEGDRARYEQRSEENGDPVTALARTIIYDTREEEIELIGNADLTQRQNEFSGGLIRYDVRAGRVVAEGEDDEGIRMILQPTRQRD